MNFKQEIVIYLWYWKYKILDVIEDTLESIFKKDNRKDKWVT